MGRLVLISGGTRSGKSRFALARAEEQPAPWGFVATARIADDEMRLRVEAHQQERGHRYQTVEAPLDLAVALDALGNCSAVVVDCLTLWVSNQLLLDEDEALRSQRQHDLLGAIDRFPGTVILVTNEVGYGMVPLSELGRRFQDAMGALHQACAARADELYLGAMGCMLRLRPAPLEVCSHHSVPLT